MSLFTEVQPKCAHGQPPCAECDRKKALAESRVLVVFAHGHAIALACEPSSVLDFMYDSGNCANQDGFILDKESVDYAPQPDGAYIGRLRIHCDNPDYWTGEQECYPVLSDVRPTTAPEWLAFIDGSWPWEPKP